MDLEPSYDLLKLANPKSSCRQQVVQNIVAPIHSLSVAACLWQQLYCMSAKGSMQLSMPLMDYLYHSLQFFFAACSAMFTVLGARVQNSGLTVLYGSDSFQNTKALENMLGQATLQDYFTGTNFSDDQPYIKSCYWPAYCQHSDTVYITRWGIVACYWHAGCFPAKTMVETRLCLTGSFADHSAIGQFTCMTLYMCAKGPWMKERTHM